MSLIRSKRSRRNLPCSTRAGRFSRVARTNRTSTWIGWFEPIGSNSPSIRTRSSRPWRAGESAATSSRSRVPRWARASRPGRSSDSPSNRWPKSSRSSPSSSIPPQETSRKGWSRRPLCWWIDRAIRVLPVPCSPTIRTVARAGATVAERSTACRSVGSSPRTAGPSVTGGRTRSPRAGRGLGDRGRPRRGLRGGPASSDAERVRGGRCPMPFEAAVRRARGRGR